MSPNNHRANVLPAKTAESSSSLPDDEAEDFQTPYSERWGFKLAQVGFRMVPNGLARLMTSKGWTGRDGPRNAMSLYLMLEVLISRSEPVGNKLLVHISNRELSAFLSRPERTVIRQKAQLERLELVLLTNREGGRRTGTIDLTPLRELLLQMVQG